MAEGQAPRKFDCASYLRCLERAAHQPVTPHSHGQLPCENCSDYRGPIPAPTDNLSCEGNWRLCLAICFPDEYDSLRAGYTGQVEHQPQRLKRLGRVEELSYRVDYKRILENWGLED